MFSVAKTGTDVAVYIDGQQRVYEDLTQLINLQINQISFVK
jgi:hypothetical protein